MLLQLRVNFLRFLFHLNDHFERNQEPRAPKANFIKTLRQSGRDVGLHFYTPVGYDESDISNVYPLVIDFHGGGYTVGRPSMDARFISHLVNLQSVKPVVVSVDYGLAPETPFPGAIEDAAYAITWLATEGARIHHLDTRRIILTGFSSGGSLPFSALIWMYRQGPTTVVPPSLAGLVSIYPGIDWRNKQESRPVTSGFNKYMTDTWDAAFYDQAPLDDALISVAAAEDDLLEALPQRIGLYPVGLDPLSSATEAFSQRLKQLGKTVSGMTEPDAVHAFDKVPAKDGAAKRKRDEWFKTIALDIEGMLIRPHLGVSGA